MEPLVFFDLETSGFGPAAEVLQIAARGNNSEFNVYIKPNRPIPPRVSVVNNLTFHDGELFYKASKLETVWEYQALGRFLRYLRKFERPCVLVAHNCPFDRQHLIRMIRDMGREDEFFEVIAGFTDTLKMFKQRFPAGASGQNRLINLAAARGLNTDGAHDARHDARLLEEIALHTFSAEDLAMNKMTYDEAMWKYINSERTKDIERTLAPLKNCISDTMITRIANAGITYEKLAEVYQLQGRGEAEKLLEGRANGRPQVIKTRKILNDISRHFSSVDQSFSSELRDF